MKLMIASDIHGSAYYCLEMLDAMKKECPDRLLLLGDILYHGPRNDLPLEYEPNSVASSCFYHFCRYIGVDRYFMPLSGFN